MLTDEERIAEILERASDDLQAMACIAGQHMKRVEGLQKRVDAGIAACEYEASPPRPLVAAAAADRILAALKG